MPDVTWHPVDENPTHCGYLLVCMDTNPEDWEYAVAVPRFTNRGMEWISGPYGDNEEYYTLENVIAWAEFPCPPEPPE